jgi:hypothetical protein
VPEAHDAIVGADQQDGRPNAALHEGICDLGFDHPLAHSRFKAARALLDGFGRLAA